MKKGKEEEGENRRGGEARSKTPEETDKNREDEMIKSYRDLKVYQASYSLAKDVFQLTKAFPKEELYSLTDQVRRSSRSITANIVEGWSKRKYESVFKRHLVDSMGSCDETKLWLDVARDCAYITATDHQSCVARYEELSKMLFGLFTSWHTIER